MNIETRTNIASKIQNLLACSKQRASNIERWVHNKYVTKVFTRKMYMRKCRSIIWNIQRSNIFSDQLKTKLLDFDAVLTQKPWEIMPDLWQKTLENHYKKHINEYVNEHDIVGLYKCNKCKSMKTKHVQVQTRSADEPMTLYVTCLECGNVSKRN